MLADGGHAHLVMLALLARFGLRDFEVVGGGAAGVELAMAARNALRRVCAASRVTLVAGDTGVMPDHGIAVVWRWKERIDREFVSRFSASTASA